MPEANFSRIKFLFRAIKYRFRNDVPELRYLMNNIKTGDSVLDNGAHKGGYLHWIRKRAGDTGLVTAFEPQPMLYEYLTKAITAYRYENVKLHHAGISSEEGSMQLFIPRAAGLTSPGATLEQRSDTSKGHFITIRVVQLDKLLASRSKPIRLIKMDVEGHELHVFKGALEILKNDRPKLIFECENRHLNSITVEEIFEYLAKLDYAGYFFLNGELIPIAEFNASKHQAVREDMGIVNKKSYANNFVFEPIVK